jgi:hypothetical protein
VLLSDYTCHDVMVSYRSDAAPLRILAAGDLGVRREKRGAR